MYGMNSVSATPHTHLSVSRHVSGSGPTNADSASSRSSLADDMKNIAKARLQRRVMADPSLARELVAVEASAVYNSRGSLIPALSTRELQV